LLVDGTYSKPAVFEGHASDVKFRDERVTGLWWLGSRSKVARTVSAIQYDYLSDGCFIAKQCRGVG
jgi:hypothetical protein